MKQILIEIYNIIMNGCFWKSLTKLEQLLIPSCAILNILQTDKARLLEVLHGFAYLYQFGKNIQIIILAMKF